MGGECTIQDVMEDKPHIMCALNDMTFLLSHEQINTKQAREILHAAWGTQPDQWDISHFIIESGLFDEIALDGFIDEVIEENAKAWDDYKGGKTKVISRLIGGVMKKTQGKADPELATKLFKERAL